MRATRATFQALVFAVLIQASASAQCDHELQGFDTFGDGWSGASVDVEVNSVAVVSAFTVAGDEGFTTFTAGPADTITTTFTSGLFDDEIVYDIYGGDGGAPPAACTLLASDGPIPTGISLGFAGDCTGAGGGHVPELHADDSSERRLPECHRAAVRVPDFRMEQHERDDRRTGHHRSL